MKNSINIKYFTNQLLLLALLFSAVLCNAQDVVARRQSQRTVVARSAPITSFQHKVVSSNTKGHITTINHYTTNNNAGKLVFITHDYGSNGPYLTQPLGVYFSKNRWRIFSQDRTPMKAGAKFNILVKNKSSKAFVHTARTSNINRDATKLNHVALNGRPNAAFIITQNWGTSGPYNKSHTGVRFSNGYWYVYNLDGKPMPQNAKFNILVGSGIFKFQPARGDIRNHGALINNAKTNGKSNKRVFITFNSQNSIKRFNSAVGVHYINNKWSLFNEDRAKLRGNEAYNILVLGQTRFGRRTVPRPGTRTTPTSTTTRRRPASTTTQRTSTGTRRVHRARANVGLVRYNPIGSSNAASSERTGPSAALPVNFSSVLSDEQYSLLKETFNLHENIYKDSNPRSNIYYYLPAHYSLKWSRETNKYDFNIYYMSAEDRSKGNVLINVELTSNIDAEDIQFAEDILSSKLGKRINLLPVDLRDVPEVEFGAVLNNFNVSPESVSTSVPSSYDKPIILDWKMESNVDNFVGAMLNNSGGNVLLNFKPYGDSTRIDKVPINLKVNNPVTYGKIKFEALSSLTEGWTNYLDYPIIPTKIIVLRKTGNRTYFETMSLDRKKIEPGEEYRPDNADVQHKISGMQDVKKVWLDYELDDGCSECNQTVKRKIIGGTSGSEITAMEIQVLNALEYSGANSIKLLIKSLQADPNGLSVIEFPPFQLTEDQQTINDIQLFVPEGKELSYQYQAVLVMDDGDVLKSKWKEGNSNLLVFGKNQIDKLFPDKKKDELLDRTKDSVLEKIKDSIGINTEEDVIDKTLEVIGGLFKKKKDSTETDSDNEDDPENN